MIIEQIQDLTDKILQYNTYFDAGYADVDLIELASRHGVFKIDNQGEYDFAMTFDKNFFYIRRNGSTSVGGNSQSGYTLSSKYRLFASAKDVDLYAFINCVFSTIGTFCSQYNITNIDTEIEKTLLTEMKKPEYVRAALQRFTTQKIFAIDFNSWEEFNSYNVKTCECNPCLNCAE